MIALILVAAGCSDGSSPATEGADDTQVTTAESSAADAESSQEDTPQEDSAEDLVLPPPAFDVLATEPTDAGPRPLLTWASVTGAATYDLVVLDAEGRPYWAWTGEDTSVFLGGVENPEAVGAWVFEPLTWIVTARDATGQPLALSEEAELLP